MITEEDATLVAEALEAHGWDEWYYALLHAALDEGADPEEAVAAADEAWAEGEQPEANWRSVRNVFCPTGEGGGVDPTCPSSGTGKVSEGLPASSKEVREWAEEWVKGLTEEEKDAVNEYTLDSDGVNGKLRSGFSHKLTEALDSSLSKAKTRKPSVVFRGLTDDPGWGLGEEFTDRGYTSASVAKSLAEDFADEHGRGGNGPLVEISLPKGSHASYIAKLSSSYASEAEILLPRGSKFKVTGVDDSGDRLVFKVELVGYPIPKPMEVDDGD